MAYIEIDRRQLQNAAKAIDTYVEKHKRNMNDINGTIEGLQGGWRGEDYNQLKQKWNEIKSSGSTSDEMLKSLENYAEYLRFVEKKYSDAQKNALRRAGRLPIY